MKGDMGHTGGLINPAPGADNTEPVFSNTSGFPKPQKREPCQKKTGSTHPRPRTTAFGI